MNDQRVAAGITDPAPERPMPANVIEALARIMEELPAIAKTPHQRPDGERGVTYAYRGIEEITAEAQELCAKYRVIFVPRVQSVEVKDIVVNDRPWTDTLSIIDWDIYGPGGVQDCIHATTAGIGRDNSDKGANKAQTAAFKYLLLPALMVSDPKDDNDGVTSEADKSSGPSAARRAAPSGGSGAPPRPAAADGLSEAQKKALWAISKRHGFDLQSFALAHLGKSEAALTKKEASKLIEDLNHDRIDLTPYLDDEGPSEAELDG